MVGIRATGDGAVGENQVVRQGRVNAPCLNKPSVVVHQNGTHIHSTGEHLICQRQICQRLVHRDREGDIHAPARVVAKNGVRNGRLVRCRCAGDDTVAKLKVGWKDGVDAPSLHGATVVGDDHAADVLSAGEDLVSQHQRRSVLVDRNGEGDGNVTAGVLRVNRVGGGGLVLRRVARNGAVLERQSVRQRRRDGPRGHVTTRIRNGNLTNIRPHGEGLSANGKGGLRFIHGDVERGVGRAPGVVSEDGVGGRGLVAERGSRDAPVLEDEVPWQRGMNAPGGNGATRVGHDHRTDALVPGEGLIVDGKNGHRLVHRDVERCGGLPAGVVGVDGVRRCGLVVRRGAGKHPVCKGQPVGNRRRDAPLNDFAPAIGHGHVVDGHVSREDVRIH